jgi:Rrf2 family protein
MKITRAGDYALRAMAYIASKDRNKVHMRSELSELCGISDSFLGKILQLLARAGMLVSERGKKGGFRLNNDPENITLYDILYAVEGEIVINECLVDSDFCKIAHGCKTHAVLSKIRENLIKDLKSFTLKDLI